MTDYPSFAEVGFGPEICDILSDIDAFYNRSLRGWFFYAPNDCIPLAEVVKGGPGWGFYHQAANGEWEWFDTLSEAQDRCWEWANEVANTCIQNVEKSF